MNRIVFALLGIVLLIAVPVLGQGDPGLSAGLSADDALLLAAGAASLDSFAFDYTAHYADDLDTLAFAADFSGSGIVDRAALAFAASIAGQLTLGTAQTIPLDTELRWVGDSLYLTLPDGWQTLENASGALANRIGEYTGLAVDPARLAAWDVLGIDGLDDLLATIGSADPSPFVTVQRVDDEGDTAHFEMSADLHALFDSDTFADGIVAFGQAQGSDLIIHTRDEVADMLRANNQAVNPATLSIDAYVGLDDHLLHRVAVHLDMQIDPSAAGYADAPFTVAAAFDATLRDQNQPQTVAAPDDAAVVTVFAMPLPEPQPPGDGTTQILYVGALDEGAANSYAVDLQAGDTVTVTARRLSLEFDPLITLLAPGGDALAENDDHDAPIFAAADYDAQIVDFAVTESGQYQIDVTDSYGGAGSYLLTISVQR